MCSRLLLPFAGYLVTNHRRRYEAFLEQLLEGFTLRHGTEITRIPKSIREIKLREFDSYGGNVQACVQAITRQRMAENDGEGHAKKRFVHLADLCHLSLKSYKTGNGRLRYSNKVRRRNVLRKLVRRSLHGALSSMET
jgi:hypothetical protein